MIISNQKTERIHALDSLRAIMMLLGLLIHSALTYMNFDASESWSLKDPLNTNVFFDVVVDLIHVFRIPVFFVVAGFFGALLFYERSPKKMIVNRFKRIVFPFIVALLCLWPLIKLTATYTLSQIAGDSASLVHTLNNFKFASLLPVKTGHLWFLYYLIYFSVISWILALLLGRLPQFRKIVKTLFEAIHRHSFIKFSCLTILTLGYFIFINSHMPQYSTFFIPNLSSYLFFFTFYLYGWLLFKSKYLLKGFENKSWLLFSIAILLFLIKIILFLNVENSFIPYVLMTLNALTIWLFIFSITGLFMRYFGNNSPRMRYVSDASYWVYLIHLPLTFYLPGLLVKIDISPFVKCLFVLSITTIFCFVSYHFFVRSTFIGKFLNGRRYPIGRRSRVELQKSSLIEGYS